MKRPAFQFYPADWRNNAKLRRCTFRERGVWIEIMCLLHDSDEYGLLRWTLKDLARSAGCSVKDLFALVDKGVLKGADAGKQCEPFVYVPRSGRKDGPGVTLIPKQPGPVWYCSRMVVDEWKATNRGEYGKVNHSPKHTFGEAPKPPIGEGFDAHLCLHPSRARPSSTSSRESKTSVPDGALVDVSIWDLGVTLLREQGVKEATARTFLGSLLKEWPELTVEEALRAAVGKANAQAYIRGVLKNKPKKGDPGLKLAI